MQERFQLFDWLRIFFALIIWIKGKQIKRRKFVEQSFWYAFVDIKAETTNLEQQETTKRLSKKKKIHNRD